MSLIRRFRDWFTHPNLPDPTEPFRIRRRERLIEAMCQTWDPSYAMMGEGHRQALHRRMGQIYDADIAPEFQALEAEFSLHHAAYGSWTLP